MTATGSTMSAERARPARGARPTLDTLIWQYLRISGAALIPLALGHLALMHIFNNVHQMDLCFVWARWEMLGWRLYDAALLGFAMLHGFSGLRYGVDDHILNPTLNRIVKWLMIIVGGAIFIAGAVALIGGVRITDLPAGCP